MSRGRAFVPCPDLSYTPSLYSLPCAYALCAMCVSTGGRQVCTEAIASRQQSRSSTAGPRWSSHHHLRSWRSHRSSHHRLQSAWYQRPAPASTTRTAAACQPLLLRPSPPPPAPPVLLMQVQLMQVLLAQMTAALLCMPMCIPTAQTYPLAHHHPQVAPPPRPPPDPPPRPPPTTPPPFHRFLGSPRPPHIPRRRPPLTDAHRRRRARMISQSSSPAQARKPRKPRCKPRIPRRWPRLRRGPRRRHAATPRPQHR